jgi:Tol biopolymer transport system component
MKSKKISLIVLTVIIAFFFLAVMQVSAQWSTPIQLTDNTAWDGYPSISSDGSKIAFNSNVDGVYEIFVVNSDGTGLVKLMRSGRHYFQPSISGDGSKIAFCSDVYGDPEIFVINSDGTGLVKLTDNTANDTYPSISSDGSKIAFNSDVDGDLEIFVINSDGTGLVKLTDNTASDRRPSISADGSKIAFESNVDGDLEIFVINSDGSCLVKLTDNTERDDHHSSISADGSKIAFQSNVDCFVLNDFEIFVINSDGTGLVKLTDNGEEDAQPSISADGSKIAFCSNVYYPGCYPGAFQIFVVNSDGTGLARITHRGTHHMEPSISSDGSKIAFDSYVEDRGLEIFMMSYTQCITTIESSDISGTEKDVFQPGESVYAIGSGYAASTTYDLYVVDDTIWTDGMAIPSRVSGTAMSVTTDGTGNIPVETIIWVSSVIGKYDIVIDVGGDGYYDAGTDALDDMDVEDAGFETIPEFSTIAIPVGAILGLLFLFSRRRKNEE